MKLPQLSLRDLFWLVLVCALAVGWWVDKRSAAALAEKSIEQERRNTMEMLNLSIVLKHAIEEAGLSVRYVPPDVQPLNIEDAKIVPPPGSESVTIRLR